MYSMVQWNPGRVLRLRILGPLDGNILLSPFWLKWVWRSFSVSSFSSSALFDSWKKRKTIGFLICYLQLSYSKLSYYESRMLSVCQLRILQHQHSSSSRIAVANFCSCQKARKVYSFLCRFDKMVMVGYNKGSSRRVVNFLNSPWRTQDKIAGLMETA